MTLFILYMYPCWIFPWGRICVYLPFDGECWKFTLWIVQGPAKVRTGGERYYSRLCVEPRHTVQVERKQVLTWSSLEEGPLWVITSKCPQITELLWWESLGNLHPTLTGAPTCALRGTCTLLYVLLEMQRCLKILTGNLRNFSCLKAAWSKDCWNTQRNHWSHKYCKYWEGCQALSCTEVFQGQVAVFNFWGPGTRSVCAGITSCTLLNVGCSQASPAGAAPGRRTGRRWLCWVSAGLPWLWPGTNPLFSDLLGTRSSEDGERHTVVGYPPWHQDSWDSPYEELKRKEGALQIHEIFISICDDL